MTETPARTPSTIVPVLVAVLACDVAVADPNSGKKNLIGIFDRIHVSRFPSRRKMSLYLRLTDAEGYYKIDVRFVQVRSGVVLGGAEGELVVADRLASTDLYIPFPALPIPEAGRYEFQVRLNAMYVGGTSVDAVAWGQP